MKKETIVWVGIVLIFCIGLIGSVSSLGTLGTFKLGEQINITQGCSGSTYSNISIIQVDGKTLSSSQISMTSTGGGSYSYIYTPPRVGYYYVLMHCNENGADIQTPVDFWVGDSSLTIILLIGIFGLVLLGMGIFQKNEYLGLFSGFLFIIVGIYILINGVGSVWDEYTHMISYVTLGIGLIISFASIYEMYVSGERSEDD